MQDRRVTQGGGLSGTNEKGTVRRCRRLSVPARETSTDMPGRRVIQAPIVYSYLSRIRELPWTRIFRFARAASAAICIRYPRETKASSADPLPTGNAEAPHPACRRSHRYSG
jgi:hypothetical protein